MNQKNSFGLNICFLDLNDPIQLFKAWMDEAKKTEPNDPNALSLATADKNGTPSVRIVLLKDFGKDGFTFYTNLDSQKSLDIENNPKAEMCFYWKSLQRQVRVFGSINKVADNIADKYFSSRDYASKISAWASEQSKILRNRNDLLERIDGFKKTGIQNILRIEMPIQNDNEEINMTGSGLLVFNAHIKTKQSLRGTIIELQKCLQLKENKKKVIVNYLR